eukprot:756613-Hanusia_phi.AAC.1
MISERCPRRGAAPPPHCGLPARGPVTRLRLAASDKAVLRFRVHRGGPPGPRPGPRRPGGRRGHGTRDRRP